MFASASHTLELLGACWGFVYFTLSSRVRGPYIGYTKVLRVCTPLVQVVQTFQEQQLSSLVAYLEENSGYLRYLCNIFALFTNIRVGTAEESDHMALLQHQFQTATGISPNHR